MHVGNVKIIPHKYYQTPIFIELMILEYF